jgi:hypothetical protein
VHAGGKFRDVVRLQMRMLAAPLRVALTTSTAAAPAMAGRGMGTKRKRARSLLATVVESALASAESARIRALLWIRRAQAEVFICCLGL